jgi:hypothetical protein
MDERRAEDKPKRGRWERHNLRWKGEFEYFDYTRWKSTQMGNSLASYSTVSQVLTGRMGKRTCE